MRVVFRADSSDRMGGGHVMRCLTLADALAARGTRTGFVCAAVPDSIAGRIRSNGHELALIKPLPDLEAAPVCWDLSVHESSAQTADAGRTAEAIGPDQTDWLVVDHYQLDRSWEEVARGTTAALLVIDDLANRPHDCDVLIDQTFGRPAQDYTALVPLGCDIFAGSRYAAMRPEFSEARDAALARRESMGPVERLLISFGSTDLGGVTARVLREVLLGGATCTIDVVLDSMAPSLDVVRALSRVMENVKLHTDSNEMARLMSEADLAIGAAGTTSWERCCLGLPTLTLVLAENQRFIASQLELAQAHRVAPTTSGESFRTALASLMADACARREMAMRAKEVADGRGSERICDALMALVGKRRK